MDIINNLPNFKSCTISIIGLGYVGLPLTIEFAKSKNCLRTKTTINNKIIGFDLNKERIFNLKNGIDNTKEISEEVLKGLQNISFTNDVNQLSKADVFIITVPTPINKDKEPDLEAIKSASKTVGRALKVRLKKGSDINPKSSPVIIYESTVYPGTTEEICIPILEKESGLKYNNKELNQGFFCGYSPERINPSDKIHTLISIIKVTSGGDRQSALWIDDLYGSIIKAGTYMAPSIKIAEAAKVIENTQRDLNIALVNELAIIFDKIGIDTKDVLDTACTKWNFQKFEPGLVGGHCISVDPYYLTYKSRQMGYYPEVVLAGRKINDNMSYWIGQNLIKELKNRKINNQKKSKVLILGFTFKENCVDIRNTKVVDLINTLLSNGIQCDVIDPWVNKTEVYEMYKLKVLSKLEFNKKYSAVLVAVAHKEFLNIDKKDWESLIVKNGIFYDLKNTIPRSLNPIRL